MISVETASCLIIFFATPSCPFPQASKNAQETANYLRVLIDKLRDRMAELYDNGTNRGYQKAYQSLAMVGQQHLVGKAMEEPNRLKNRYANINPYDHSRVVLPLAGGDPYSDYINASWVDGYKKHNGYIASQGPVPNSFIDFWRMVWEAKVRVLGEP
jgi:protein tyrosine phosphatase